MPIPFLLYFALLWIPPILKLAYIEFNAGNTIHFAIYVLSLYGLYFLLNKNRKYFLWITSPLLLINIFQLTHFLNYNEIITVGGWAAIFESNYLESKEFVLARPSSYMVFFLHIIIFGTAFYKTPRQSAKQKSKTKYLVFLLYVLFAFEFLFMGFTRAVYPLESLLALQNYFEEKNRVSEFLASKSSWKYNAIRADSLAQLHETYIVVIGESARRQNMEVYGYPQGTNPFLKKEKLIVFKDVISPVNLTRESLRLVLTPGTVNNPDESFKKSSIVSLAKEAGFTSYWIGNQSRYGFRDSEITAIAKESHHQHYTNTYWAIPSLDEKVLPVLDNILKQPDSKKIIFIHLLGSHIDYKKRVPKNFNTPNLKALSNSKKDKIIYEYNLSVAYQDSLLAQMINNLNALNEASGVIYLSDHGELLFDNGHTGFGHGYPTPLPVEFEVPFLVWLSEKYRETFPLMAEQLNANSSKKIQLENFFYAVAHLLHIHFEDNIPENNFFGKSYSEPPARQVASSSGKIWKYENLTWEP